MRPNLFFDCLLTVLQLAYSNDYSVMNKHIQKGDQNSLRKRTTLIMQFINQILESQVTAN